MKLTAVDNIIERSGIDNEQSFSIKASGKAFKILSDGLYSNKIGAVIRELSCNAFDSHVAAKKADVPFEIHLPTSIEPWFSVKDFGIGLSHEDVIHLYSTYFESTKNQSNDFVGAFGLGSKSPFSYVDSFSVTSVFEGKRRAYTAFISEDGTPKISMFNEQDYDMENCVEVQVPVKDLDIRVFKDNAKVFLKYFNPLPKTNFPDLEYGIRKPTLQGNGWRYYSGSRYDNKSVLIQGHVAYPLDQSSFGNQILTSHIEKMVRYFSMEIDFDIGELEVAASREALSYNKETVKNIIEKLKTVHIELKVEFEKFVANVQGSEWEKNLQLRQFKSQNYELFEMFDPQHELIKDISLDFNKFDKAILQYKTDTHRANKKFTFTSKATGEQLFLFHPDNDQYFFINDVSRPSTWFMNHFSQAGKSFRNITIFVINPSSHPINEILDSIGNPPVMKTSELVRPPKKERVLQNISIPGIAIPKLKDESYWNCHWADSVEPENLPDRGLYFEIERNRIVYNNDRLNYTDILRKARKLKFFEDNGYNNIYLFKRGQLKLVNKNPKWSNAREFIISQLDKWFSTNKEEYAKYLDYRANKFKSVEEDVYKRMKNHTDYKKLKETPIKEMLKVYKKYSEIEVDADIISLAHSVEYKPDLTGIHIENIKGLIDKIYERYPLLRLAMDNSSYNIDNAVITSLIDYIDMLEHKNITLTNT